MAGSGNDQLWKELFGDEEPWAEAAIKEPAVEATPAAEPAGMYKM